MSCPPSVHHTQSTTKTFQNSQTVQSPAKFRVTHKSSFMKGPPSLKSKTSKDISNLVQIQTPKIKSLMDIPENELERGSTPKIKILSRKQSYDKLFKSPVPASKTNLRGMRSVKAYESLGPFENKAPEEKQEVFKDFRRPNSKINPDLKDKDINEDNLHQKDLKEIKADVVQRELLRKDRSIKEQFNPFIIKRSKTESRTYFIKELKSTFKFIQKGTVDDKAFKTHETVFSYFVEGLSGLKMAMESSYEHPMKLYPGSLCFPERPLLVLDLDETLIHCTGDISLEGRFQMKLDFRRDDGVIIPGLLNLRPYVREFLAGVSQHYEIAVFTASLNYYAHTIIDILDPKRDYISHVLDRNYCSKSITGQLVKDLRVFSPKPLNEIILVDNNMYTFAPQLGNGVPIFHYFNDDEDTQLKKLQAFLMSCVKQKEVATPLADYFKLEKLLDAKTATEAFCTLLNEHN